LRLPAGRLLQPTEVAPTNLSVGAQHAVPGAASPKNSSL